MNMNPKEWRDRFTELWYSLGDGEIEKMDDFITNLLEAVAVEVSKENENWAHRSMEYTDGFKFGLDTAANLIRSLKNYE